MSVNALTKVAAMLLLASGSAASAQSVASGTFRLQLVVPVICTVQHRPALSAVADGYMLGNLQEYCNAPSGYRVALRYAPGSMRGAVVSLGQERVVLDGSGHAVISQASGPRVREREIFTAPGPQGFDTDRIEFTIEN